MNQLDKTSSMDKDKKGPLKKKKLTLIEIAIVMAIILIIGNFIYWCTSWREVLAKVKEIGLFATLALFVALYFIKKWIEK